MQTWAATAECRNNLQGANGPNYCCGHGVNPDCMIHMAQTLRDESSTGYFDCAGCTCSTAMLCVSATKGEQHKAYTCHASAKGKTRHFNGYVRTE